MAKNITEKNLAVLAKIIGIPLDHGWKTKLQLRLKQKKPSILSTWIKRGLPSNFDNILVEAGIDPKVWENIEESGAVVEATATENIGASDVAGIKKSISEQSTPYKGEEQTGMPLRDVVRMQAETILELQRTINRLHEETAGLHKSIENLGTEIGEIKTTMWKAALSGDISGLGILTVKGPRTPN